VAAAAALALAACARPPQTAADIVARSVDAHGGAALTSWRTMTVTGTVRLQDGIAYNAAYTLYAQAPGKLRVEHDLTADRGRAFYEYFLNGGVAWTRRNLVVSAYDPARAQRLLDHCVGVAYYTRPGITLERLADAEAAWPPVEGWDAAAVPGPRRAYVLTARVGADSRELAIDTETFHVLRETIGTATRYYGDVRAFGALRLPTRVLEVVKTQNRQTATPFVIVSVVVDAPLDAALFTEDQPKGGRAGRAAGAAPE
jgi:hypothetical protein